MDNVIDAVGRNFERLLRWAYPSGLFLVLLYLARPSDFAKLALVMPPWGLVIGGLVAGAIAYFIQGYFFNQLATIFFVWIRWDVNIRWDTEGEAVANPSNWILQASNAMAQNAGARWKATNEGYRLLNWLDYAWGVHHAMAITAWLIPFFVVWSEPSSRLHWVPDWPVFVIPVVLLISSLWFHAVLVRIRIKDFIETGETTGEKSH